MSQSQATRELRNRKVAARLYAVTMMRDRALQKLPGRQVMRKLVKDIRIVASTPAKRGVYDYRASQESKHHRRGASMRKGLRSIPPAPWPVAPRLEGGWDRNHPPANGAREIARRARRVEVLRGAVA